jgi:hypothetical protein
LSAIVAIPSSRRSMSGCGVTDDRRKSRTRPRCEAPDDTQCHGPRSSRLAIPSGLTANTVAQEREASLRVLCGIASDPGPAPGTPSPGLPLHHLESRTLARLARSAHGRERRQAWYVNACRTDRIRTATSAIS